MINKKQMTSLFMVFITISVFAGSMRMLIIPNPSEGTIKVMSYNIHQYTDCADCHSVHGLIRVEFDTCLCHAEIPSFHDETTTSCEPCHDTTVIHTQP